MQTPRERGNARFGSVPKRAFPRSRGSDAVDQAGVSPNPRQRLLRGALFLQLIPIQTQQRDQRLRIGALLVPDREHALLTVPLQQNAVHVGVKAVVVLIGLWGRHISPSLYHLLLWPHSTTGRVQNHYRKRKKARRRAFSFRISMAWSPGNRWPRSPPRSGRRPGGIWPGPGPRCGCPPPRRSPCDSGWRRPRGPSGPCTS